MANPTGIRAGRAYVEVFLSKGKFEQGLRETQTQFSSWGRQMQSAGQATAQSMLLLGAPLALITKLATGFDDAMRTVGAVVGQTYAKSSDEIERLSAITGESTVSIREQSEAMSQLEATARELGKTTSFTSKQIADSMVEMARAGLSLKEIDESTKSIMHLARATGTTIPKAANIAIAAMRSFQKESKDMAEIADVLTTTANSSPQTIEDLGHAMKYIGPVANAVGVSLQETARDLGLLANFALKGEQGGAALRNIYMRLASVRNQAKYEAVFGVKVTDENGEFRKLPEIFAETQQQIKNLGLSTVEVSDAFKEVFSLRALAAAFSLMKSDVSKMTEALDDAGGQARETSDEMDAGIGGAFRMFVSRAQEIGLIIGDSIIPALDRLLRVGVQIMDAMMNAVEWISPVVPIVAGLGTALLGLSAGNALLGQTSKLFAAVAAQAQKGYTVGDSIKGFTRSLATGRGTQTQSPSSPNVRVDTVERAQKATRLLGVHITSSSNSANAAAKRFNKLYLSFGKVAEKARNLQLTINALTAEVRAAKSELSGFATPFKEINGAILDARSSTNKLTKRLDALNDRFTKLASTAKTLPASILAIRTIGFANFNLGVIETVENAQLLSLFIEELGLNFLGASGAFANGRKQLVKFSLALKGTSERIDTFVGKLGKIDDAAIGASSSLQKFYDKLNASKKHFDKFKGDSKVVVDAARDIRNKLNDVDFYAKTVLRTFKASTKSFAVFSQGLATVAQQAGLVNRELERLKGLTGQVPAPTAVIGVQEQKKPKAKSAKLDKDKSKIKPKEKKAAKDVPVSSFEELTAKMGEYQKLMNSFHGATGDLYKTADALKKAMKVFSAAFRTIYSTINGAVKRLQAFDDAMKNVRKKLDGFAARLATTFEDAKNRVKVPFAELKEIFSSLRTSIAGVVNDVKTVSGAFGKINASKFVKSTGSISESIKAIAAYQNAFISAIQLSGAAFASASVGANSYAQALARIVGSQTAILKGEKSAAKAGATHVVDAKNVKKTKEARTTASAKVESVGAFQRRVLSQAGSGVDAREAATRREQILADVRKDYESQRGPEKASKRQERKAWNEYKRTSPYYAERMKEVRELDDAVKTQKTAERDASVKPYERDVYERERSRERFKRKASEAIASGKVRNVDEYLRTDEGQRENAKLRAAERTANETDAVYSRTGKEGYESTGTSRGDFTRRSGLNREQERASAAKVERAKTDVETARASLREFQTYRQEQNAILDERQAALRENLNSLGGVSGATAKFERDDLDLKLLGAERRRAEREYKLQNPDAQIKFSATPQGAEYDARLRKQAGERRDSKAKVEQAKKLTTDISQVDVERSTLKNEEVLRQRVYEAAQTNLLLATGDKKHADNQRRQDDLSARRYRVDAPMSGEEVIAKRARIDGGFQGVRNTVAEFNRVASDKNVQKDFRRLQKINASSERIAPRIASASPEASAALETLGTRRQEMIDARERLETERRKHNDVKDLKKSANYDDRQAYRSQARETIRAERSFRASQGAHGSAVADVVQSARGQVARRDLARFERNELKRAGIVERVGGVLSARDFARSELERFERDGLERQFDKRNGIFDEAFKRRSETAFDVKSTYQSGARAVDSLAGTESLLGRGLTPIEIQERASRPNEPKRTFGERASSVAKNVRFAVSESIRENVPFAYELSERNERAELRDIGERRARKENFERRFAEETGNRAPLEERKRARNQVAAAQERLSAVERNLYQNRGLAKSSEPSDVQKYEGLVAERDKARAAVEQTKKRLATANQGVLTAIQKSADDWAQALNDAKKKVEAADKEVSLAKDDLKKAEEAQRQVQEEGSAAEIIDANQAVDEAKEKLREKEAERTRAVEQEKATKSDKPLREKDFRGYERDERKLADKTERREERRARRESRNARPDKTVGNYLRSYTNAFSDAAKKFGLEVQKLANGTTVAAKKIATASKTQIVWENLTAKAKFGAAVTIRSAWGLIQSMWGMASGMIMAAAVGAIFALGTKLAKALVGIGETAEEVADRLFAKANKLGEENAQKKTKYENTKETLERLKTLSQKEGALTKNEVEEIRAIQEANRAESSGSKTIDDFIQGFKVDAIESGEGFGAKARVKMKDDEPQELIAESRDELALSYRSQINETDAALRKLDAEYLPKVKERDERIEEAKNADYSTEWVSAGPGYASYANSVSTERRKELRDEAVARAEELYAKEIAGYNSERAKYVETNAEALRALQDLNVEAGESLSVNVEGMKLRVKSSVEDANEKFSKFVEGEDVDPAELVDSYRSVVESVEDSIAKMKKNMDYAANAVEFAPAIQDFEKELATIRKTARAAIEKILEEEGSALDPEWQKNLRKRTSDMRGRMTDYATEIENRRTLTQMNYDEKFETERTNLLASTNKNREGDDVVTSNDLSTSKEALVQDSVKALRSWVDDREAVTDDSRESFDALSAEEKSRYESSRGVATISTRFKEATGQEIPEEIRRVLSDVRGPDAAVQLFQISRSMEASFKKIERWERIASVVAEVQGTLAEKKKTFDDEERAEIDALEKEQGQGIAKIAQDEIDALEKDADKIQGSFLSGLTKERFDAEAQKKALDESKDEYVGTETERRVREELIKFDIREGDIIAKFAAKKSAAEQGFKLGDDGEFERDENGNLIRLTADEKQKHFVSLDKEKDAALVSLRDERRAINETELRERISGEVTTEFQSTYDAAIKKIDGDLTAKALETYSTFAKTFQTQIKLNNLERDKRVRAVNELIAFYGESSLEGRTLKKRLDAEQEVFDQEQQAQLERQKGLAERDFLSADAIYEPGDVDFESSFHKKYDETRQKINDGFLAALTEIQNDASLSGDEKEKRITALKERRETLLSSVERTRTLNLQEERRERSESFADRIGDYMSEFAMLDPTKLTATTSVKKKYNDLIDEVNKSYLAVIAEIENSSLPEKEKKKRIKEVEERQKIYERNLAESKEVAVALEKEETIQRAEKYTEETERFRKGTTDQRLEEFDDAIFQSEMDDARNGLGDKESTRTKLLKRNRAYLDYQKGMEDLAANENKISRTYEIWRRADRSGASLEEKEKAKKAYEDALAERSTLKGDLLESVKELKSSSENLYGDFERTSSTATTNAFDILGMGHHTDWQRNEMNKQTSLLERISENTTVDSRMI